MTKRTRTQTRDAHLLEIEPEEMDLIKKLCQGILINCLMAYYEDDTPAHRKFIDRTLKVLRPLVAKLEGKGSLFSATIEMVSPRRDDPNEPDPTRPERPDQELPDNPRQRPPRPDQELPGGGQEHEPGRPNQDLPDGNGRPEVTPHKSAEDDDNQHLSLDDLRDGLLAAGFIEVPQPAGSPFELAMRG